MKSKKSEYFTASENKDGTFRIPGTRHNTMTYDDLEKLQKLQGGHWVIFRDYSDKQLTQALNMK